MVIESLKAASTALKEAMKDKGMSEDTKKILAKSDADLQKLLAKAREAAGMPAEEEGYEEGMPMGHEGVDAHKVAPGHKVTKTTTVQHDGPKDDDGEEEEEEEEEGESKADAEKDNGGEDNDAEESRKVHLQCLLTEAGIPKKMWNIARLMQVSLKEAKAMIAEKKAYIEVAKEAVIGELDFVPAGSGTFHESTGGENLNGLFSGCAE
jgi:hypothetical protein